MPKHQDTLLRHWHMLRLVPRHPRKITVQDMHRALASEGYEITERSLQRDLVELSHLFPLDRDDRDKPYGWRWQKDAPNLDLPSLSASEALTFALAEAHLQNLLPASLLNQLRPYFRTAHQRLDAEPAPRHNRRWLDKVRSVPATQPLLSPPIAPSVQDAVTEALLCERQLNIRYRRPPRKAYAGLSGNNGHTPDNPPIAEARIHPLALVQRGPILYLSCLFFDYEDARTLALHRIEAAEVLYEPSRYPQNFSIDQQIEQGTWGFGSGEKIALEVIFDTDHGGHLHETPLSTDQTITPLPDGRLHITATVVNTPQLTWWLLGFGGGVEVLQPPALRTAFQKTAARMAAIYAEERRGA